MIFKIIGLLGDPVRHSLSPAMQNAALRHQDLPYRYLPFGVHPSKLKAFLEQSRSSRLAGFNVTIPHKERILRYLDWVEPAARLVGAVNTVVVKKGRLVGYNTDGAGYLLSLKDDVRFNPKGKRILILGAGGAARALLYSLGRAGASEITVSNRNPRRAKGITRHFRPFLKGTKIKTLPLKRKWLERAFPKIDLLINATSVGMGKSRLGVPFHSLSKNTLVSDLVYRPQRTIFLAEAKRRGLKTHSGLGMLLKQGALSFRLWTGRKPDIKIMKKALLKTLKMSKK